MISYYPEVPTRTVISLDGAWQFSCMKAVLEEFKPDFFQPKTDVRPWRI